MTSRKYPPNCSPAKRREIDNLSDHAAYAYGLSDEKPGPEFWIVQAVVIAGCLIGLLSQCVKL